MTTHPTNPVSVRSWERITLKLAAIYNVAWGALVVLAPSAFLGTLGVEPLSPQGTAIWQCVGMIVGVYGVGYWAAASDPHAHWPIVLVGLLGKVFGPIGFADAVFIKEIFPLSFGFTIITNDLIWWVPFTLILVRARAAHRRRVATP